MTTVPALAGISQPRVPGREFSRCTGLGGVTEVPSPVDDVLPRLDPPHALRTSATIVAQNSRRAKSTRAAGPGSEECRTEEQLGPGEVGQFILHGSANRRPRTARDPLIY